MRMHAHVPLVYEQDEAWLLQPRTEKRNALFTEEANRFEFAIGQYALAVELSEVQRSKPFKLQILQVQRASPFPVTPNCDGGLQWGNTDRVGALFT